MLSLQTLSLSTFILQIIKCDNRSCCKPYRSNLKELLYQGFLPAPYRVKSTEHGIVIPPPESHNEEKFAPLMFRLSFSMHPEWPPTKEVPYDLYCPSVLQDVDKRTCDSCGVYFASKSSADKHRYVF